MIAVLFSLGTILSISGFILEVIYSNQKEPYMDEVFHIPQARHFCDFNFTTWDSMITTLPGLYLSSVAFISPLASLFGVKLLNLCTLHNLRTCNLIFCAGNFVLIYLLTLKLNGNIQNKKKSSVHPVVQAAVLTLFPVLHFFTWLYYTDPGSTFFTLLMYLLCLHRQSALSALTGVVAIMFRQTNVIWVLFCFALVTIEALEQHIRLDKKISGNINNMKDFDVLVLILKTVFSGPARFFALVKQVLVKTFWFNIILCAFIVFVYLNNGIAVGDRTHHNVSFNVPQVFYFLTISAAFSFMHVIHPRQIWTFVKVLKNNPLKTVLFMLFSAWFVRYFTYEHAYTLSDNRHYSFYFWSKIYRKYQFGRYLMLPVYLYSLQQFYSLTLHKGFLWRLTLSICIILVLVPQALLEFRYFIIPFYILRLNMQLPSIKMLVLELLMNVGINAFTVYMFVNRPFLWPGNSNLQKFMW